MKSSEQLNELFTALSKAQGMLKPAEKDNVNPFYKSKYATFDACWTACREALEKNGLSVIQGVVKDEGELAVESILGHSSGQYVTSIMPLMLAKKDIQAVGSAISYAKRYLLCAQLGLTTAEAEDDGEKAMEAPRSDRWSALLKMLDGIDKEDVEAYINHIISTEPKGKKLNRDMIIEQALANATRFVDSCKKWAGS